MISVTIDGNSMDTYLVSYTREKDICSSEGIVEIGLSSHLTIIPYDIILTYEGGIKTGTFYVDSTEKMSDGTMIVHGRDNSKRAKDYFISDQYTVSGDTTSRYWIGFFLSLAGISYNFTTTETGYTIQDGEILGPEYCSTLIEDLIRHSGWYWYYDKDNVAQIGKLTYDSTSYVKEFSDSDIIDIIHNQNDQYLRNRAVIWGAGYRANQEWTFADITVSTPWNYDANDVRAILARAGFPIPFSQAIGTANILLNEYARLVEEKTVQVYGTHDVKVGDFILINSSYYNRSCLVSNLNVGMTDSGIVTTYVLDRRCPRFVGFYDVGGIVYAGTEADGVWTKPLKGTQVWTDYSAGLGDLSVKDLDASYGVLACVTNDGRLWGRTVGDSQWYNLHGSSYVDSISLEAYPYTSGEFIACNINDQDQTIYGLYTISGIGNEHRTWVSSFPSVYGNYPINTMILTQSGEANLRGYDIESDFDGLYISTDSNYTGSLVYRSRAFYSVEDFGIYLPEYTHTTYSGIFVQTSRNQWFNRMLSDSYYLMSKNARLNLETGDYEEIYDGPIPSMATMNNVMCLIDSNTGLEINGYVYEINMNTGTRTELIYVGYPVSSYSNVIVHEYLGITYVFWTHTNESAQHYIAIYNYTNNTFTDLPVTYNFADSFIGTIYLPFSSVYGDSSSIFISSDWFSIDNYVTFVIKDANKYNCIYCYNIDTETLNETHFSSSGVTTTYHRGAGLDRENKAIILSDYYSGYGICIIKYSILTNTIAVIRESESGTDPLTKIIGFYYGSNNNIFTFRDKVVYTMHSYSGTYLYFYDQDNVLLGTRTLTTAERDGTKRYIKTGDDINQCIVLIDQATHDLFAYNIYDAYGSSYIIENFCPSWIDFSSQNNYAEMFFQFNKIVLVAGKITDLITNPPTIDVFWCPPSIYTIYGILVSKVIKYSEDSFVDVLDGGLPYDLDISYPSIITASIGISTSGTIYLDGIPYTTGHSRGQLYFSRTGLPGHFRSLNLPSFSGSYLYTTRSFTMVTGEISSFENFDGLRTCIGFVRMSGWASAVGDFSYIDITGLDDIGGTVIFPDTHVIETFTEVPETLDISNYNYGFTPYFLVGTRPASGTFYQRNADESSFVEESTGLPNSKITIIRLDEMV